MTSDIRCQDQQYVLDGGSLLHRISWAKDKTYCETAKSSRYGRAIVIFDGYGSGPSTKDMTHLRRSEKHSLPEVILSTVASLSEEDFFVTSSK